MDYNTSILSLGYILSKDRSKVLMLYHNANPNDYSYGKYNGYSDFIRSDENAMETFERVAKDMTGLKLKNINFRGSIHWPNFRHNEKSFFSQIFICDECEGIEKDTNVLGNNRWIFVNELLRGDVPIWEGDKHFLPLVFDDNPKPFHGIMPYDKGNPFNWMYKRG